MGAKSEKRQDALSYDKVYEMGVLTLHHLEARIENIHKFYIAFCVLMLGSIPFMYELLSKSQSKIFELDLNLGILLLEYNGVIGIVLLIASKIIEYHIARIIHVSKFLCELEKRNNLSLSHSLLKEYANKKSAQSDQQWIPVLLMLFIMFVSWISYLIIV